MNRTTPIGLLTYAKEFLDAALAADDKLGKRPGFEFIAPVPVMYLAGHSIELSLKSFLLSRGVELEKLKNFGHDLHRSFRKAKELGLPAAINATAEEVAALEALNGLYRSKQLNYMESGEKRYPMFGYTESLARRLIESTQKEIGHQ
jgi:hypothetical protein